MHINDNDIPDDVLGVLQTLEKSRFQAYLVGGCVRDLLCGITPNDWDIATDATPDQIQKVFSDSVYENEFGTVLVKLRESKDADVERVVEVTTFRKETTYSDKRHPDQVMFSKDIEEDLARRDFTINAIALKHNGSEYEYVDPYQGEKDITKKIIRAVGNPESRFAEDALRMMRAVRFFAQLDFEIEKNTYAAIKKHSGELSNIASERIRDEFVKIIMTPNAARGVVMLYELGLLEQFAKEIVEGVGVEQNLHHIYSVWEHCIRSLDYAARHDYSLEVRLAALLHDVGKPRSKQGEGKTATFYNHEIIGAKMTRTFLTRLAFPKKTIATVTHLVRQHQFYYNIGEVSEAGVRRFVRRVGAENIDDLIKVREADRIGSGVPKAVPYKLRHFLFMIEKVRHDPVSVKMLAINGDSIMKLLSIKPSRKVGMILNALMEEVLDDPSHNTKEYLERRAKELGAMSEKELEKKARKGKEKQESETHKEESKIKRKFHVQ